MVHSQWRNKREWNREIGGETIHGWPQNISNTLSEFHDLISIISLYDKPLITVGAELQRNPHPWLHQAALHSSHVDSTLQFSFWLRH